MAVTILKVVFVVCGPGAPFVLQKEKKTMQ